MTNEASKGYPEMDYFYRKVFLKKASKANRDILGSITFDKQ